MTSYRYPSEHLILALTLLLVFAVIAVTAVATLCGSVLFVLVMLVISFLLNRSHHNELIQRARPVTSQTEPALADLAAVLLYFAFRWWNRACEYSADRAGLLACGKPEKAASALIKLAGGSSALRSTQAWQQALHRIEAEDDHLEDDLREMLSTHPMTVRRLEALRQYAASPEYHRLQDQINHVHPI